MYVVVVVVVPLGRAGTQFDRAINVDVGQTGGRYHSVDGGQMVGSHHQWL